MLFLFGLSYYWCFSVFAFCPCILLLTSIMSNSGDRHTRPQIYKSGNEKRKQARERNEGLQAVLSKTRKIDSFFKSTSKSSSATLENSETDDAIAGTTDSFTQIPSTRNEQDAQEQEENETNSSMPMTNKSPECVDEIGSSSSSFMHQDFTCSTNETTSPNFKNDIGLWETSISSDVVEFWIKRGSDDLQNAEKSLLEKYSTPQIRPDRPADKRKCPINIFSRVMKNGELVLRKWLCFSPATGKVYCFVCKLMQSPPYTSKLADQGFCDWKKVQEKVSSHENSPDHLSSLLSFTSRATNATRIDCKLTEQVGKS